VDARLTKCPRLADDAAATLAAAWSGAHRALAAAAVKSSIMANQLVDMEWKFGVTAASDEVRARARRHLSFGSFCCDASTLAHTQPPYFYRP
jgi:hypothetical protein